MEPKKIALPILLLIIIVFIVISPKSSKEISETHVSVEVPEEYNSIVNPVSADEASLTKGERLYNVYCDTCHGKWGESSEGVTQSFEVPPSPLTEAIVGGYTDGGMFYLITEGVEDTKMRPYKELSEEERWHIVNYVNGLQTKGSILDKILGIIP